MSFSAACVAPPNSPFRAAIATLSASRAVNVSDPVAAQANSSAITRPTAAPASIMRTRLWRSARTPPTREATTRVPTPAAPMTPALTGSSVTISASSGTAKPASADDSSKDVSLTSHVG